MSVERRGQVIRVPIMLVNWQQEEPTDCGEGRQLFMDDTSRVSREAAEQFALRVSADIGDTSSAIYVESSEYFRYESEFLWKWKFLAGVIMLGPRTSHTRGDSMLRRVVLAITL